MYCLSGFCISHALFFTIGALLAIAVLFLALRTPVMKVDSRSYKVEALLADLDENKYKSKFIIRIMDERYLLKCCEIIYSWAKNTSESKVLVKTWVLGGYGSVLSSSRWSGTLASLIGLLKVSKNAQVYSRLSEISAEV